MTKKIPFIALCVIVLVLVAAFIFGAKLGNDFKEHALIKIGSKDAIDAEKVNDIIKSEMKSELGDYTVQTAEYNYIDEVVINSLKADEKDVEKLLAEIKKINSDAFLISVNRVENVNGTGTLLKYTLVFAVAVIAVTLFMLYRFKLQGALLSVISTAVTFGMGLALGSLMGIYVNAESYITNGILTLILSSVTFYAIASRVNDINEEDDKIAVYTKMAKKCICVFAIIMITALIGYIFSNVFMSKVYILLIQAVIATIIVTLLTVLPVYVRKISKK